MIRVVCADLSRLDSADYQMLYEMAGEERKARADRCRRREDALRCVAADALLRYALGSDTYTVEKTPLGKPFIRGREDFHYNLSHSGNWVVMAYGDGEVGVDVERLRTNIDTEALARRFFTPEEQRYMREEPDGFYWIWTGKESYLKYLGTGLTKALNSFSILFPKPEVRIHHRILPDGSHLSLCTAEREYLFEMKDLHAILSGDRSLP